MGAKPIGDNSTFLHLRTGRIIADTGIIPRRDIYSSTARGTRWVVQSWLPEWTYAWAWKLGGLHLLVFEQAVLTALVAVSVAACARTGEPLRTAGAAGIAVAIGAPFWSPRPLLVGILAFALTVLVVERRKSAWWLIPIVWVWVSSHGSFPLGLVWLTLAGIGTALDERRWPSLRRGIGRYWAVFVLGLGIAAANPLGVRLLGFALTVGQRRDVFARVVEWQSPDFQDRGPLFSLVFLVLALLVLVRQRVRWSDALPAVAFVGASLLAARNLPMAAVVLAPCLGRALVRPEPASTRPRGSAPIEWALAAVLGLVTLAFAAHLFSGPAVNLSEYPVAAARFLDARDWLRDGHLVHDDVTGGYLILRNGTSAHVFFDDRFDMYPTDVSHDSILLTDGDPRSLAILERRRAHTVLWPRSGPLAAILKASDGWRQVYSDKRWVVFRRV